MIRIAFVLDSIDAKSGGSFTFQESVVAALLGTRSETFEPYFFGYSAQNGATNPYVNLSEIHEANHSALSDIDSAILSHKIELVWFLTPRIVPVLAPYVVTIWDLEHRKHGFFPEISIAGWTWHERENHFKNILSKAFAVATGTLQGRREIHQFYGFPIDRIFVVPLPTPAWPEVIRANRPTNLPATWRKNSFYFYPAQFWAHKNHMLLIRMLILLRKNGVNAHIAFCGADHGNKGNILNAVDDYSLRGQVAFLDFVPLEGMAWLYQNAIALLFPSFFGPDNLPPLEAMKMNCPVIMAGVSGAPEHYGKAALYFQPGNVASLIDQIRKLTTNAEGLRVKGKALAAKYSLQNAIAKMDDVIDLFSSYAQSWGTNYLNICKSIIWIKSRGQINWKAPYSQETCSLTNRRFDLEWEIDSRHGAKIDSVMWQPMTVLNYRISISKIRLISKNGKIAIIPGRLLLCNGRPIFSNHVSAIENQVVIEILIPKFIGQEFDLHISGEWELANNLPSRPQDAISPPSFRRSLYRKGIYLIGRSLGLVERLRQRI